MKLLKTILLLCVIACLSSTEVLAEEEMSTALLTTGESSVDNKRVHQTEIPWFVWYQDGTGNFNVTGGSFAEIDAYTYYLSQTTFNNREVPTLREGGEINKLMLTTSEFSRLGAASQYLLWLSEESYGAEDIENIIAGHVNIAVQKPLEALPGIHVTAAGSYNKNGNDVYDSDGTGGQAGISYAEQFLDDTLGVMYLSSYENIPVAEKQSKAWYAPDWDNGAGRALNAPNGFTGATKGGSDVYLRNYLGLQWQPSSSFELNYDILYSTHDKDTSERGYEISNINRNESGTVEVTPAPSGSDEVFAGIYANDAITAWSVNSEYEEDEDLLSTGLGLKYNHGLWTVGMDVDYAKSEGESTWTAVGVQNINAADQVVTLPGDGSFSYNQDLLNLKENIPLEGSFAIDPTDRSDELGTIGVDVKRELDIGLLESLEFGVRGTDREAEWVKAKVRFDASAFPSIDSAVQGAAQTDGINYLIFDIDQVIANNFPTPVWNELELFGFEADESTVAGYAKLNFSRKFDKKFGLIGNVGLRAVSVETDSKGLDGVWSTTAVMPVPTPPTGGWWDYTPVSGDNRYTGLLPSLNLTLFPDWGKYAWTFSASRRIAKAPLEMLDPSVKTYAAWPAASPDILYIDYYGNPELDPWEINQFDLKFDWHFMDFSYISAVASYKYLDTYIAQDVEEVVPAGPAGEYNQRSTVRPINKHGDSIRSLALRYNQRFAFIPKGWGIAGLFASGVVTDSDATETARDPIPFTGEPLSYSLRGLADVSTVSALWWMIGDWGYTHRHKFRSEYTTAYEDVKLATVEPASEFSFRVAYTPTKKLSFMLEIQNLTNEEYSTYADKDKRRPIETTKWGQSYLLGLNYTF